ncbi:MAG: hypothetical protein K6T88_14650 [Bacillus sp. (in: Bacteria)]|nr:hypothetical protein [Bacillus sp. (in: firmicutes)]
MGQVIPLVIIIILIPFVLLPILFVGLQILLSPPFWIILVIVIAGVLSFYLMDKKRKGYLSSTFGYIALEGVDSSKMSILRLYPDNITVNDVQIIPIERVKKAAFDTQTRVIRGYRTQVKEHTYVLTIQFINKIGNENYLTCRSKVNQGGLHYEYMQMEQKINKQVGYVKPKQDYPNKPHEL